MNKQEIILHKICKYYIPDDWYQLLWSNPIINNNLCTHQLRISDSVHQETIDKIFKTFKLYSFKIGGY